MLVLPADFVGDTFEPWPRQAKIAGGNRLALHWTFRTVPPRVILSWLLRRLGPGETLSWAEDRIGGEARSREAAATAQEAAAAAAATSPAPTAAADVVATVDAPRALPEPGKHVVVLLHGINTEALWQNEISMALDEAGFKPVPIGYGVFGLVRFLLPFRAVKMTAMNRITSQLTDIRAQYRDAPLSIIAHSFGTYGVFEFLRGHHDFRICRLILCGGVLPRDTDFTAITSRFEPSGGADEKIVNDCGTHDIWPVMAEQLTWGYGATGVFGFKTARVRDRWHDYLRHSDFLNEQFCREFWIPFLREGVVIPGAKKVEAIPGWLRFLARLPIKYIAIGLAIAITVLLWTRESQSRYSVVAGGNGIGFANNELIHIADGLERRAPFPNPLDWLRGRRSHVLESVAKEELGAVAVRGNFECIPCYPNQALDAFMRRFPACLRIGYRDGRIVALGVNPDGVEDWRDPTSERVWKLCKVRQTP